MLLVKFLLIILLVILIIINLLKFIKKEKFNNTRLLYLKVFEMFIVFFGIIIAIPLVRHDLEIEKIAKHIINLEKHENVIIYSYQMYPQSLPPLIKSQIGIIEWKGELKFGISKLENQVKENRFPDSTELLLKKWKSKNKILLILKNKKLNQLQNILKEKLNIQWKGEKYVLVSNFK